MCLCIPVFLCFLPPGGLGPFYNRFKDLFIFNCVSVCLVLKPEEGSQGAIFSGAVSISGGEPRMQGPRGHL